MPPIAAARNTLGDGRTRITNPNSATAPITAVTIGPARQHSGKEQRRSQDHHDVAAGYGDEVGHAGRPERVRDGRIEPGRVAVDEPRQQPAHRVRQTGTGPLQPGPQGSGRPLWPWWPPEQIRRRVDLQQRGVELTGLRRREPAVSHRPLPG